jgi:hypothetical protein
VLLDQLDTDQAQIGILVAAGTFGARWKIAFNEWCGAGNPCAIPVTTDTQTIVLSEFPADESECGIVITTGTRVIGRGTTVDLGIIAINPRAVPGSVGINAVLFDQLITDWVVVRILVAACTFIADWIAFDLGIRADDACPVPVTIVVDAELFDHFSTDQAEVRILVATGTIEWKIMTIDL